MKLNCISWKMNRLCMDGMGLMDGMGGGRVIVGEGDESGRGEGGRELRRREGE